MKRDSKLTVGLAPVAVALTGNIFVTLIKGSVAFISGSSVMFAEAVHSVADTLNQTLLLIGVIRSSKKPDTDYSYGYGAERFFWALISACGIFFVGAGITIWNGVNSLLEPEVVSISYLNFAVLGVAFMVESVSFIVAIRAIAERMPKATWRERLEQADPATLSVFLEDGLALIGILIALGASTMAEVTGNSWWDATGSILIGLLLGVIAVLLIMKNRSYLLGQSIPEEVRESIISFLESDPAIERVLDFKSSILDIGVYRIKCEVEFNGSALFREAYQKESLREHYDRIHDFEEFKKFCVDYADRIPRLIGKHIDVVEAALKERFPSVRHIDIEVN